MEESEMYMLWMGDNMWLFVPVQQELQKFFASLEGYPFREGRSLNVGDVNYQSLKAMKITEELRSKGLFERPGN